jgi:hypothetical protein
MEDARIVDGPISLSPRLRFRIAAILAIVADALQLVVFPLFSEGALSPADDALDLAVAFILVRLLGWHWEFLPAFAGRTRAGSRFGSVLDVCGRERLPQMERVHAKRRGTPAATPSIETIVPGLIPDTYSAAIAGCNFPVGSPAHVLSGTKRTISHEKSKSRMPRFRPLSSVGSCRFPLSGRAG